MASDGPGAHRHPALEAELGVEDALPQLGDRDGLQRPLERGEHVAHEVVVIGRAVTTPCCANAMAVASTAPIQIGR
jgi:hypothetical protein